MRNILKPALILFVVCVSVAFLLALTYNGTKEAIALRIQEEAEQAMQQVMPEGEPFEDITQQVLESVDMDKVSLRLTQVYHSTKGYVFHITVSGYSADRIIMTVGIDHDLSVTGVAVGRNTETPSIGKLIEEASFTDQFMGFDLQRDIHRETDVITSATISSEAVIKGVDQVGILLKDYLSEQEETN